MLKRTISIVMVTCVFGSVGCGTSNSNKATSNTTAPTANTPQTPGDPSTAQTNAALQVGDAFVKGAKWTYDFKEFKGSEQVRTSSINKSVRLVEKGQSGFVRVYFTDNTAFFFKDGDVYTREQMKGGFTTLAVRYKNINGKATTYKTTINGKSDVEIKAKPVDGELRLPSGSFKNCVEYTTMGKDDKRVMVWCDGVGLVSSIYYFSVPGAQGKIPYKTVQSLTAFALPTATKAPAPKK